MNNGYLIRGYLGRYCDYTVDIETVQSYKSAIFSAKYHIKFYEKIVIFKQPYSHRVAIITMQDGKIDVKEVKDGKSKEV